MSSVSQRSDTGKKKELKVLELHHQGYSYRKIASLVHMSLRDVTKFINLASNKIKSPSSTSIHDEIILEYRVTGLRHEVKDLEIRRENLKDELTDLHAQIYNVQYQLNAKQSELNSVMRNLEYEKFSNEIMKDIFTEGQ
jgi:predicted  nucleic acid-binding Zn-ribbon protein